MKTENGAIAFENVGVLNFFSHAGAMRGHEKEVEALFYQAYQENDRLATKALFWLRNARGGAGERELFRHVFATLASKNPALFSALVSFVPEFGRWDDLTEILDVVPLPAQQVIIRFIQICLNADMDNERPSLMAKWLPSPNAGKRSRTLARIIYTGLEMTEKNYRKILVDLRSRLDIVETKMSAQKWDTIEFAKVPARAAFIYRKAFQKNGGNAYINSLAKIKATHVQPYELYNQRYSMDRRVLQAMWDNLPNYVGDKSILVMADTSGSMARNYGLPFTPLSVSVSMAVYAAMKNTGPFAGTYLTFSREPKIVNIKTRDIGEAFNLPTINHMNTNLQAAFEIVLEKAVSANVPPDKMPKAFVVISDMQFDEANNGDRTSKLERSNYEELVRKFSEHGYSIPLLVFWNVNARNTSAPVRRDDVGAVLISGLSAQLFKSICDLKFDVVHDEVNDVAAPNITPYQAMLQVLESDAYVAIDLAFPSLTE